MRLISIHDYSLRDFSGRDTPPYAILSHTWGDDEVSFQDMQELAVAKKRKGFRKIELCCRQARLDGWAWAWVDTCCIDKTSSVELSEAVNSMFQWYARSMVCYAYLSDWYGGGLRACRWLSRGWTLQELIAPLHVKFYNYQWEQMGTKKDLKDILSDITGVPTGVLDQSQHLSEQTIGSRMHWASRRKTTREEDMSYCLLGIFDVNMPLLYGEGSKRAFLRLQEEIVKKWDDHTLFIWDYVPNLENLYNNLLDYSMVRRNSQSPLATFLSQSSIKCPRDWTPRGIMADHPSKFVSYPGSIPLGKLPQEDPPQVTSRGLRLSLYMTPATSATYPPLTDYRKIAYHLRGPWGSQEFLSEARSYDREHRYSLTTRHWISLPTYLAALDCTGPDGQPSTGTAQSSTSGQEEHCAVLLLIKVPGSVRTEFMLAPYFCHSVPVSEVKKNWDLKSCYIKLQPPADDSSMSSARPAMCEVRWSQRDFGYRLKAQSWTGGFFSSFSLQNLNSAGPEKIIFVSCGMRPGFAFLDARLANSSPKEPGQLKSISETEKGEDSAATTDKGKSKMAEVHFSVRTPDLVILGGQSKNMEEGIFDADSDTKEICNYWREQGVVGRLNWTRVQGPKPEQPGPVLQTTVEICEGKTLSLTLHFDRTFSDGELTVSGLEVDQYTLWLGWQKQVSL